MTLKQQLVAHRGDQQSAPENSVQSIQNALNFGALYIEFDIQLSKDCAPIVIHDSTLSRTTNIKESVFNLESSTLITIPLLQKNSNTTAILATLEQVVDCINAHMSAKKCTIFVEVKEESILHFGIPVVLQAITKALKLAQFTPVIISYHYDFITQAQQQSWQVGWINDKLDHHTLVELETLQPSYMFSSAKALLQHDITPTPWQWVSYTSNTLHEAKALLSHGVNLVETNYFGKLSKENSGTDYDVIIIGAGINGAGVAKLLCDQNRKVLVLEQNSAAGCGTSSKSSKLIHGGLRYLETFNFKLVFESLKEQHYLLRTFPDLVKRTPFYIPVTAKTTRPRWKISLGLSLYYLLSGLRSTFRTVPKQQWQTLDNLNCKNIQTIFQYYDAQTDDKALTQAVLAQAQQVTVYYQKMVSKIEMNSQKITVHCGETLYHAKHVVNAAGPWVNEVLATVIPLAPTLPISLIQGTHIVLNTPTTEGCYYVEAESDQRAVFVMPWKNQTTLVGTTEVIREKPEQCKPTTEEQLYLLKVYNQHFSKTMLIENIIETTAGLRVLPKNTNNASKKSREVRIHTEGRVTTIYGGKLTTWRATARKVIKEISL